MSSGALAWVQSHVGGVSGIRQLTGGMTSTLLAMESGVGPVVLRVIDREPWRSHGPGLATRESDVQEMLADFGVAAPESVALDAEGEHCRDSAHLMTLLPGRVEPSRSDPDSLEALAETLADIHEVRPSIEVRDYQSWAWEAKYVVPAWASRPSLWEDAFALLRTEPPAYEPCFIHRDFQPRNVLWEDDTVSGVVDWVETSMGPAWLDVAHCATNLAISHGVEVAQEFCAAYSRLTGRPRQPYFEVMDAVGFLPPPGKPFWYDGDEVAQRRLEEWLALAVG